MTIMDALEVFQSDLSDLRYGIVTHNLDIFKEIYLLLRD